MHQHTQFETHNMVYSVFVWRCILVMGMSIDFVQLSIARGRYS